jgi:hypothetical protein
MNLSKEPIEKNRIPNSGSAECTQDNWFLANELVSESFNTVPTLTPSRVKVFGGNPSQLFAPLPCPHPDALLASVFSTFPLGLPGKRTQTPLSNGSVSVEDGGLDSQKTKLGNRRTALPRVCFGAWSFRPT